MDSQFIYCSRCDGVDNDCDGLVDNGLGQLNCTTGSVCWNGECIIALNATVPLQIWPKGAPMWFYDDSGQDMDKISPQWRTGYVLLSKYN